MNRATIIKQIPVNNYNSQLGYSSARINNKGLRWNYDSAIELFIRLENTVLSVSFSEQGSGRFDHTDPAEISIEARFYFVENIGQPYAQAFISGGASRLPDEREISIALYIFERSNLYERYTDMLRNERPVYLEFSCDVDEDDSHYRDRSHPNGFALLPLEQISIEGLSSVRLKTSNEDVGEGE